MTFEPYYVFPYPMGWGQVWCVIDRTSEDTSKKEFADEATAKAVARMLNTQWRLDMGFHVD